MTRELLDDDRSRRWATWTRDDGGRPRRRGVAEDHVAGRQRRTARQPRGARPHAEGKSATWTTAPTPRHATCSSAATGASAWYRWALRSTAPRPCSSPLSGRCSGPATPWPWPAPWRGSGSPSPWTRCWSRAWTESCRPSRSTTGTPLRLTADVSVVSLGRASNSRQEPFPVTETDAQAIGGPWDNRPAYDGQWGQAVWALISRGASMIEYWHWHTHRAGAAAARRRHRAATRRRHSPTSTRATCSASSTAPRTRSGRPPPTRRWSGRRIPPSGAAVTRWCRSTCTTWTRGTPPPSRRRRR